MIKRIELVIQSQNLTPSQFADRIGIQRSGLSHILSGRNNPSLDFVQKVLAAFPELNPIWFLQGKGRMYANLADMEPVAVPPSKSIVPEEHESGSVPLTETEEILGQGEGAGDEFFLRQISMPADHLEESSVGGQGGVECREDKAGLDENLRESLRQKSKIRRILLFYEDGTFEEYTK